MSSQETMEIVPQKIEENIKYIENDVTNNVIHSMNDIQKSESPKNSPKNLEKKSLNDISEGKSNAIFIFIPIQQTLCHSKS